MAEVLIKNGATVDAANNQGNTPLHLAMDRTDFDQHRAVAELLVKSGANVKARNVDGQTPMNVANKNRNMNSFFSYECDFANGYFFLFLVNVKGSNFLEENGGSD